MAGIRAPVLGLPSLWWVMCSVGSSKVSRVKITHHGTDVPVIFTCVWKRPLTHHQLSIAISLPGKAKESCWPAAGRSQVSGLLAAAVRLPQALSSQDREGCCPSAHHITHLPWNYSNGATIRHLCFRQLVCVEIFSVLKLSGIHCGNCW